MHIQNMTKSWESVESKIHTSWSNGKTLSLDTLKANLFNVLRGDDWEDVSELCAIHVVNGVFVPSGVIDVVCGFICAQDANVRVDYGGCYMIGNVRTAKANEIVSMYQDDDGNDYPLVNTSYHELCVRSYDDYNIEKFVVGVRLSQELRCCLQGLRLPGVGIFKDGMFSPGDASCSVSNIKPLP
jgi:hypothetical protein